MLLTEFETSKREEYLKDTYRAEGRAEGMAEGKSEEKADGLDALVEILKPLVSSADELYRKIVSNGHYSDVSFETVKQLFEKK